MVCEMYFLLPSSTHGFVVPFILHVQYIINFKEAHSFSIFYYFL